MQSGTFSEVTYTGRIKHYPNGDQEIMACSKPIFRMSGWEERNAEKARRRKAGADDQKGTARAIRRARAAVRDIAMCNPMSYFVTLTLDGSKVDRHDMTAITRKLNAWLSNQVQRRGLKYVLVPERHKDGAIHFHGFFNDALPVTDSGTIVPPGGGKPRRPRSKAQRAEWLQAGGQVVYNLPGWSLGFTTAMDLYGEYSRAVSYVCKYIGKDMGEHGSAEKIGGRWYYSGGDLAAPEIEYADIEWRDLLREKGAYIFTVVEAGAAFTILRKSAN